jgi:hypothetical protein
MSTETGTAVQSATGHPQLVESVARLHVPALTQPEAMVSLDSGEQIINKNQNWHMQAWLTVDKQSGALTGYCRTWCTDNSVFGAGFHGGVSVNFVDAQGNLVSYLPPQRYGVSGGWDFTGPHDRSDSFPGQIDPAAAARVTNIVFGFGYDPYSQFIAQLEADLLKAVNQSVTPVLNLIQSGFAGVISWVASSI